MEIPVDSSTRLDRDLEQITAAIEMVVAGVARRIQLVGLADAAEAASVGLARAQGAGVAFSLDRGAGRAPAIVVGPREPRVL